MKRWALVIWLLLPIGAAAYHYGPGRTGLKLDEVDRLVAEARELSEAGAWKQAILRYQRAQELLPDDQTTASRRLRLELYKAQLEGEQLPAAHSAIGPLIEELAADPEVDPAMLAEARELQANSRFYMTWLMRLEGQPETVWRSEIDSAEETYRLLAEQADSVGLEDQAAQAREDLESAIRLARMDLGELQGLPLPSQ